MEEVLRVKGWQVNTNQDANDHLGKNLWSIAHATQKKTSIAVRLYLQSDTNPPNKADQAAKQHILTHLQDIREAGREVAQGIDRELMTIGHLTPRYVNTKYISLWPVHSK